MAKFTSVGATGQSFILKGNYATLALFNAGAGHSPGQPGDAWIIESDGSLMVYSTVEGWIDAGDIIGPQGPVGPAGQNGTNGTNGTSPTLTSITTDVLPSVDNVYNLGNSSYRWHSINVGPGTINITDQTLGTTAGITVSNGVLQINGANQLQVGQLKFVNNTIESTTGSVDIQIGVTSSSANLVLNRNTTLASGKSLTFGDNTVQTTAFIPGVNQLNFRNTPPAHMYGAAGDKAYDACLDSSHLYICSANYVNNLTTIWKRIAYSSGNW